MDSATLSLVLFIVFTLIYFIYRYFEFDSQHLNIVTGIYVLSVISSQFSINISATKELCGEANYGNAFLYTLIPWGIIFGLLHIVLFMFPGWKSPFANTFGYLLAKAGGVKSLLLDHILKAKFKEGVKIPSTNSPQDKPSIKETQLGGTRANATSSEAITNSLEHIYGDPSALINEVTPETFDTFWTSMTPLFRKNAEKYRDQFKKLVNLKDLVSEFVWYLLTGVLVCSMSYNSILNQGCNTSVKEMQKRHQDYEDNVNKIKQEDKDKPPARVYYTKD